MQNYSLFWRTPCLKKENVWQFRVICRAGPSFLHPRYPSLGPTRSRRRRNCMHDWLAVRFTLERTEIRFIPSDKKINPERSLHLLPVMTIDHASDLYRPSLGCVANTQYDLTMAIYEGYTAKIDLTSDNTGRNIQGTSRLALGLGEIYTTSCNTGNFNKGNGTVKPNVLLVYSIYPLHSIFTWGWHNTPKALSLWKC